MRLLWNSIAKLTREILLESGLLLLIPSQENPSMSAPSRRPEIRRRRARQHKITTLRKRLASAQTDADRNRITAKLHKLSVASPGQPLVK